MEKKYNKEMRDIFGATDVVAKAKSQCLQWAGHVIRGQSLDAQRKVGRIKFS